MHFGIIDIIKVPIVIIQTFNEVAHHAQGISVILRIADIADAVHEILGGHCKAGVLAFMIYPVHALSDFKRPDGLILVGFPALRDGGNIYAIDIRLDKAVDAIGNDGTDSRIRS